MITGNRHKKVNFDEGPPTTISARSDGFAGLKDSGDAAQRSGKANFWGGDGADDGVDIVFEDTDAITPGDEDEWASDDSDDLEDDSSDDGSLETDDPEDEDYVEPDGGDSHDNEDDFDEGKQTIIWSKFLG